MISFAKVSPSDGDIDALQETARLASKQEHFRFRVSLIVEIASTHFYRTRSGQKP